jgi:hypothetical protein
MALVRKVWTSRISSCEFASLTLRDDGLELQLMDDRGTLRNVVSYEQVRVGAVDETIRNDFGAEVLREVRELVG